MPIDPCRHPFLASTSHPFLRFDSRGYTSILTLVTRRLLEYSLLVDLEPVLCCLQEALIAQTLVVVESGQQTVANPVVTRKARLSQHLKSLPPLLKCGEVRIHGWLSCSEIGRMVIPVQLRVG